MFGCKKYVLWLTIVKLLIKSVASGFSLVVDFPKHVLDND